MNNTQKIIRSRSLVSEIQKVAAETGSVKPFLVCGRSFMKNDNYRLLLDAFGDNITTFHDYTPNPKYESVLSAMELYRERGCDMLISIGGGSPMDVTKSIKAYINQPEDALHIEEKIVPNRIIHLAIPTTAGTGSESTHFAVIYYNGKKCSVSDASLLPDYVILDPDLLSALPEYQRKATMMDALCHAMESFCSVKSSQESRRCSEKAIETFFSCYRGYLNNDKEGNSAMLEAANLAGQAINLTTTTAAHAMCYKLTSLYGISHGHAAALCYPKLLRYMLGCTDQINDPRGETYVKEGFQTLASILGCETPLQAAARIEDLIDELALETPVLRDESELDTLVSSVNVQRLSNNPIRLDSDDLRQIYRNIFDDRR